MTAECGDVPEETGGASAPATNGQLLDGPANGAAAAGTVTPAAPEPNGVDLWAYYRQRRDALCSHVARLIKPRGN